MLYCLSPALQPMQLPRKVILNCPNKLLIECPASVCLRNRWIIHMRGVDEFLSRNPLHHMNAGYCHLARVTYMKQHPIKPGIR
jgi:hypothetical protein